MNEEGSKVQTLAHLNSFQLWDIYIFFETDRAGERESSRYMKHNSYNNRVIQQTNNSLSFSVSVSVSVIVCVFPPVLPFSPPNQTSIAKLSNKQTNRQNSSLFPHHSFVRVLTFFTDGERERERELSVTQVLQHQVWTFVR